MGSKNSKPTYYYHCRGVTCSCHRRVQTITLLDLAKPGFTPVFRDKRYPDGFGGFLKDDEKNDLDTSWKIFS